MAGFNRLFPQRHFDAFKCQRLKPLRRFVAKYPNDLWQSDVMGKMRFLYLGYVYLIASIDDHSLACSVVQLVRKTD